MATEVGSECILRMTESAGESIGWDEEGTLKISNPYMLQSFRLTHTHRNEILPNNNAY